LAIGNWQPLDFQGLFLFAGKGTLRIKTGFVVIVSPAVALLAVRHGNSQ
jgi:hypothetical protein